jgi:integrase
VVRPAARRDARNRADVPVTKSRDPYKRHKTKHSGITYRLRKSGGRTYSIYANGRQHRVQGGEAEAIARQAELRNLAARGQRIVVSKIKLSSLADDWIDSKRKYRDSTVADYRADLDKVILPRFGHLQPAQISVDAVAALIRELEAKPLSGARIKNILKPLNGTLTLAVRRGLISHNPIDLLTSDERPHARTPVHHVWSPEEIGRLLSAAAILAAKPFAKYDYTALLTVAIYTGMRIGELRGLRWCDVDLKNATLQVRHQANRKGKLVEPKTKQSVRRIPLGPTMVALLTRHRLASPYSMEADCVFASNEGTPLNARNVATRGLAPALEAAGLSGGDPKITFHELRHAFASMMIERGMTSIDLANVMGHRDSRTTETIYIHLFNRVRMEDNVRIAMQSAMEL